MGSQLLASPFFYLLQHDLTSIRKTFKILLQLPEGIMPCLQQRTFPSTVFKRIPEIQQLFRHPALGMSGVLERDAAFKRLPNKEGRRHSADLALSCVQPWHFDLS